MVDEKSFDIKFIGLKKLYHTIFHLKFTDHWNKLWPTWPNVTRARAFFIYAVSARGVLEMNSYAPRSGTQIGQAQTRQSDAQYNARTRQSGTKATEGTNTVARRTIQNAHWGGGVVVARMKLDNILPRYFPLSTAFSIHACAHAERNGTQTELGG